VILMNLLMQKSFMALYIIPLFGTLVFNISLPAMPCLRMRMPSHSCFIFSKEIIDHYQAAISFNFLKFNFTSYQS